MSLLQNLMRDGSSPRRASMPCVSDTLRAPSRRDQRAAHRSKLREGQATEEKKLLQSAIDQQVADVRIEQSSFSKTQIVPNGPNENKTYTKPRQEKPHKSDSGEDSPDEVASSSFMDDKVPCVSVRHPRRVMNSTGFEQSQRPRIAFPSAGDPIWKNVNTELQYTLPQHFQPHTLKSLSCSELADLFDEQVYSFFLDKFGEVPAPIAVAKPAPRKRRHRVLERLRKLKNRLKRKRRVWKRRDSKTPWHMLTCLQNGSTWYGGTTPSKGYCRSHQSKSFCSSPKILQKRSQ